MHEKIIRMIDELLEISAFELEFQHRAKANPFSEKWINCTRTKTRIKRLRRFLYKHVQIVLNGEQGEKFYHIALENYFRYSFERLQEEMKNSKKTNEIDPIYRQLYYRLSLENLFVVFTNLLAWEHNKYPYILENMLINEYRLRETSLITSDDLFIYYIRFLDILSSSEIISLFDLDALKNTIYSDMNNIGNKPLRELNLIRDWPETNKKPFNKRFPDFKSNISRQLVSSPNP